MLLPEVVIGGGSPLELMFAPVVEVRHVRDPEDPEPPDAAETVRVELPLIDPAGAYPLGFSGLWA